MDLMGHGIKSSLDLLSEVKSSLDFILLSQNRFSIGTAVCKWMDETVCRFAFLSPYPSSFSLLPFPRIPYTPVLLCCCASCSATTESIDSDPSLFSQLLPLNPLGARTPCLANLRAMELHNAVTA